MFIEHLQIVTTYKDESYSAVANSHALQFITVFSVCCVFASFRHKALNFDAHVLTGRRLTQNYNTWARTSPNTLLLLRHASLEDTASQVVYWCVLGICCLAGGLVYLVTRLHATIYFNVFKMSLCTRP
jgi:hypothetical protein